MERAARASAKEGGRIKPSNDDDGNDNNAAFDVCVCVYAYLMHVYTHYDGNVPCRRHKCALHGAGCGMCMVMIDWRRHKTAPVHLRGTSAGAKRESRHLSYFITPRGHSSACQRA
jgi:hypothetical protein